MIIRNTNLMTEIQKPNKHKQKKKPKRLLFNGAGDEARELATSSLATRGQVFTDFDRVLLL